MMSRFILGNRGELLLRHHQKVAQRTLRGATPGQVNGGIPLFLDQLRRTLEAEERGDGDPAAAREISGDAGDVSTSELGLSAAEHGTVLFHLGYSIDQVVHEYGDVCQAITDLAEARDVLFAVDEFRTLNRCLDNAIADAVNAFANQRRTTLASRNTDQAGADMPALVHEFRNAMRTANLAVAALEAGHFTMSSNTGSVLKRCLAKLTRLCEDAFDRMR